MYQLIVLRTTPQICILFSLLQMRRPVILSYGYTQGDTENSREFRPRVERCQSHQSHQAVTGKGQWIGLLQPRDLGVGGGGVTGSQSQNDHGQPEMGKSVWKQRQRLPSGSLTSHLLPLTPQLCANSSGSRWPPSPLLVSENL